MKILTKKIICNDGKYQVISELKTINYPETWKPIFYLDIDTGYKVSSYGRVIGRDGKLCKLYYDKDGYTRFSLYIPKNDPKFKNEKAIRYPYKTHRAVAIAFVKNDSPGIKNQVMHKNDIKDCNFASNLVWGTARDNMEDKIKKGRLLVLRGSNKKDAIFNENDVKEICELLESGIRNKNEIIKILNKENMPESYLTSYKNLIANIKKRHCWNFVTKDYKY